MAANGGVFGALLGPVVSGLGSLLGGIFGGEAAGNAAGAEVGSQNDILKLIEQDLPGELGDISGGVSGANAQLGNQYSENLGLLSPYLSTGTSALAQLNGLTGAGGFQAPTAAQAALQPGYQFQQQQGELALNQTAAAGGGLDSGGALKAAEQYGQGLAQTDYSNVYNQALGTYQTNFGNLSSLANLGAGATNTGVSSGNILGSEAASNTVTGGLASAGAVQSSIAPSAAAYTNIGNAQAGGIVGQANALTGAISGVGNAGVVGYNNLQQLQQLQQATGSQYNLTPAQLGNNSIPL